MKQPDNRYSDMFYGGKLARREFLTARFAARRYNETFAIHAAAHTEVPQWKPSRLMLG